jgi:GTP-binding protein
MAARGAWRPPSALPEIAFAGRSNVGKSALLNRLVRRRGLARVSNTPGRTRAINFFAVNGAFVLVDLPGYGFARVSKGERASWRALIEGYFRSSPTLRGLVLLLDARHEPSRDDLAMRGFVGSLGIPVILVLTKCDKVSRGVLGERAASLAAAMDIGDDQVISSSAVDGRGRDELASAIEALLAAPPWRRSTP